MHALVSEGHDIQSKILFGKREKLNELRRKWGWDGVRSVRKWSKEMLIKCGYEADLLHLPRQFTSKERAGEDRPRNFALWREIEKRFPDVFTWEIRNGKGVVTSCPTVDGDYPTLFELLVMPRELADQWVPEAGGGFKKTRLFGKRWHQPWVVQTLARAISVRRDAVRECLELLEQWQRVFPQEETFVQHEFGIPSLLVRFDCVYRKNTGLGVYEIEERPAGVGISLVLNEQFKILLSELQKEWPEFLVVVSPRRTHHGGDDYLWVPEVSYEKAREGTGLLLVRADPDEVKFHAFAGRSVSVVATKGLKSYGVTMGLWRELNTKEVVQNPEQLPWSEGFCIKPFQGSKTRGVTIHEPFGSSDTERVRILNRVQSPDGAYLQPFIPPLRMHIGGKAYNYIFRIFFGYSPKRKEWLPLGGNWDARPAPEVLIHGALDAVAGSATLGR